MTKTEPEWHTMFFSSEAPGRLRKYDADHESHQEVEFIIDCLNLGPNSKLLDLCCGKGRHLLEFLRRGIDVVGADSSEYMLSEYAKVAKSVDLRPKLFLYDIISLP